jgi:hypothetical protein
MRRIAALLFVVLCLLSSPGCEVVCNFFRDSIFGGLSEKYDSSHATPGERRSAYDDYIRENVDNQP